MCSYAPCELSIPVGTRHPSPLEPLRIHICSPLSAIEKLIPEVQWCINIRDQREIQPAATSLAWLVSNTLYGPRRDAGNTDWLVVREERLGWKNPFMPSDDVIYRGENRYIDYYETTFDHLVPLENGDPEVMLIMIYETEYDGAAFAQRWCPVTINPLKYMPHQRQVLAYPHFSYTCRASVNDDVKRREAEKREQRGRFLPMSNTYRARGIGEEWPPPSWRTGNLERK